ncbi:MAG: type VI secretion system baseplate subunit TssF [Deltaproteobacteria bacterium]|nr:type VI secretion system baseplate subunit TssF [Deltaproteobacteria bacterium]
MRLKSRYYDAELAYLREQGREFARAFPSTAGLLAERSDDPDVERLLEGFAFLASRIRERVDDGMPELAQQLGSILVPQLTRYIPSCAIVQFEPEVRSLRMATAIPRGAGVAGVAADGSRCRFVTTADTDLLPIELVDVRTDKPSSRTERITLQLRIPPHGVGAAGERPLRLYLHGELPFTSTLRTWWLRHCVQMVVYDAEGRRGALRGAPQGRGFEPDSRLLPQQPLEHDAFGFVAEIFAFPQKFCFVDLPPLGALAGPEIELRCTFESPPELSRRLTADGLRLHCAPVINLFETTSDPVRFEPLRPEAVVRGVDRHANEIEVYDVMRVQGLASGRRRDYAAFASFGAAAAGQAPHDEAYYVTRRTPSMSGSGTELYVSLMSPRDSAPIARSEVLALDLLCSNRGAAATLGIGDIDQPVRGSPVCAALSNITVPTPPLYPHDDVELLWRLTSHVGASHRGLQCADTLRRTLRTYNFAATFNPHQGRLISLWIDAISEVHSRKIVRLHRGAPVTGTQTTVVVDETVFGGAGEAVLLGECLSEMYGRRASLNSFSQLVVRLAPSAREYRWKPRNGERTIG